MRKLFLLLCLFISWAANSEPATSNPQRIVSLKPNITEILFALGVGDKVVGVTTWCDYPAEAKKLPKIADYININSEKIIALKPDLVIGSQENAIKSQFEVIREAGINTINIPFRTLDDLFFSIDKIAEAVGKKQEGKQLVKKIKKGISSPPFKGELEGVASTLPNPPLKGRERSVLILVGHHPLVAAGENTFYGDIVKLAGAKNIIDGKIPYPTINTELITARSPDVIVDLAMGTEQGADLPEILRGKVRQLDISEFRAGPRIGEAVKKLSKHTSSESVHH